MCLAKYQPLILSFIHTNTSTRQQWLTLLYKVVKGHVPAINIQHYLRAQRPKRTIRAKKFIDFVKTNIVEKSVCNNNQCFVPIQANSESYKTLSSSEQPTTGTNLVTMQLEMISLP